MRRAEVVEKLESLYGRYHRPEYISSDPLAVVRRYSQLADREVVALLAAGLAYGRVASILNSLDDLLNRMDHSPAAFVYDSSPRDLRRSLAGFQHRWTTASEVEALAMGLRRLQETWGGLEESFVQGMSADDSTVLPGLSAWVQSFEMKKRNSLLADPSGGSACKRMCLFLRWLVREDSVDPGGWSRVPPSKLVVPVDVHMHRMARRFGFTRRKSADRRTAEEITRAFRRIAPDDPTRYDFALTRPGILGEEM